MKKLLLLFSVLLVNLLSYGQEISLGTGTTTGILPIDPYYKNSYSQQIYTKSEINAAGSGVITGIKFYTNATSVFNNSNQWTVSLAETNDEIFNTVSDWKPFANFAEVFSGEIFNDNGVVEITFTTPFTYTNTANLVVSVSEPLGSGYDPIGNRLFVYNATANTSLYRHNDSAEFNFNAPQVGTRTSSKSRITFIGLEASSLPICPIVSFPASNATNIALLPTITWAASNSAASYNIKIGTTAGASDVLNVTNITATSYTLTNTLSNATTYFLTVEAVNEAGDANNCSTRQFTTAHVPPSNDECVNAIPLTVNPDLSYNTVTAGTTLNATMSMAATPCSGTPNDDVWFSFVATSTMHQIKILDIRSVGTTSGTDMYFQVLSGSCGDFTSLLCSDPETNVITNLTVGQTYYIRVYTWTTNVEVAAEFNIGIGTAISTPIPANDDCQNAVSLTVNPDLNYAIVTPGTTASATQSMEATPCSGTSDDDVWYSFVATNPVHYLRISDVTSIGLSSTTTLYTQVLSGSCATSLESVKCNTTNSNQISGLTVGQTYYVRVYTSSNGQQFACNFSIGVGTPPPPPANDECEDAITLTPGATFAQNAIVSTNASATNNSNVPTPTCEYYNFTTNGKDVWFKVNIPASGTLTIETNNNADSAMTDTGMSAYTGTCSNLSLIECDADDSADGNFSLINLVGRTPGEEILVRVWGYSTHMGSFRISAYDASLSSDDFTKNTIKLYPNPFTTDLQISSTENIVKATVIDLTGKVVKTFNNPTTTLPLSELSSGIYMVTLQNANGVTQTIKAIKK